jgi:hypothetical protein
VRWLILATAFLVTGCMSSGQSYTDLVAGWRIHGDASVVTVVAPNQGDAQPLAAGHCNHFKKTAQFDRQDDKGDYRYLCLASR